MVDDPVIRSNVFLLQLLMMLMTFLARNSRDRQHDEVLGDDIEAYGWESP